VSGLPDEAAKYVTEWLGPDWTARPLAGDASVRAYYRITAAGGETWILSYYPREVRAQLRQFIDAYEAVTPHASVPALGRYCDFALLQRDVGDRSLYDVLHEDREEGLRLYRAAIDLLVGFQRAKAEINEPFTAEWFERELEMAREFYVDKLSGIDDSESLKPILKKLAEKVARHPYVLCHRDFHGQNLHISDDTVYLIDYQDLRMGPHTYDLAALLRDRGVGRIIGDAAELELLEYYGSLIGADGGLHDCYFETLLQRSIKILGTFSKQPITRGKMHYLEFIPPTLESIERCLRELPEWRELETWFPNDFSPGRAEARARMLALGSS
jgi:aminoglycoside/choline kinase family phosphotransferase